MMRTILTTVGTSLLTNAQNPWKWKFNQPLPDREEIENWLSQAEANDDRNNPRSVVNISAELHTWYRLGLMNSDRESSVIVVLIHSDTDESGCCADQLVHVAERFGMQASSRKVKHLCYEDGTKFNRGLRELARVIGEEIKKGQKAGSVELAATGGFKAEVAVANLVGALCDTPVHYIYHEFSSIVTIAPIPVALRAEWINQGFGNALLNLFATADELVPWNQVENLIKSDERLIHLVDIDQDCELVALSLMGEIAARLRQNPPQSWPPTIEMPPREKIHLDNAAHHRPHGWERIINKIANSGYVSFIRYEGQAAGGVFREAADNDSDLIHRIEGDYPMSIRITTTATDPAQRRMVQSLLKKEIR
jgi:putative CRISPR-associated protein (TIGR02619 family)